MKRVGRFLVVLSVLSLPGCTSGTANWGIFGSYYSGTRPVNLAADRQHPQRPGFTSSAGNDSAGNNAAQPAPGGLFDGKGLFE